MERLIRIAWFASGKVAERSGHLPYRCANSVMA